MDVSVESKSLPSVGYSRKSYLQTTFQRLARDKLVHLNGWRSLALPSVGPGSFRRTSRHCEKNISNVGRTYREASGEHRGTVQNGLQNSPGERYQHCAKWLRNSPGERYQRIRICISGEVETHSSPIRRQAPDAKYPENVERHPARIMDVRHPGGMAAEQNFECETSGWNGSGAEFRMIPYSLHFGFAYGKGLQSFAFWIIKTSQVKEGSKEENKVKKIEDSSCSLPSHFWSTSRSPFSTYYIPFQRSGSQDSNASNCVRFGAEMRKIWPSEDNCSKLMRNSHNTSACVKFAHPCVLVSCNLCMPYWIRDQEGRLVRIENPQDTELDICVNIMDPPPEDQNSQQRSRGTNGLKRQISNFSAKENEKFHECWERYMEAINACPHHGLIHGSWRLEELELKKMHEVQAISETQAHVMPCTICQSCDHVVDECPTMPALEKPSKFFLETKATSIPTTSPNQAPQQTSSVEQAIVNLSKVMGDFVGEQKAINSQLHQKIENVESSQIKRMEGMQNDLSQKIDNIQYSISRLTNLNTLREVKAVITLRSGKEVDQPLPKVRQDEELMSKRTLVKESNNQEEKSGKKSASKSSIEEEPRIVIKEDMMKKHMPPPFPQALHGKKEIKNSSEILEDLCTVKRGLHVTKKAFLTEQVSAIIQSKSPVKYKDPGCPTISVNIGGTHVEKALLDLGASVNLLPYSVYKQLGLGGLKPTTITLSLADSKLCANHPGRPFLATSNAIINCRNGVMQLTFGNMTLELNIFHLCKRHLHPEEEKDWRRCA
ncbi:hypothetical protein CK203_056244 [Vitis vinifera]|uniref:Uncharacterized protein n=1 Tax=Vitis vinifera TaxID=29760 RepID=A0A438GJG2_VITVI|nr:hypothetical protein CK203_056244 [Vitis vinifera]